MKASEIEDLMEKYDAGETSLEEEQLLSDYFMSENVAPHLQVYAAQFTFFTQMKKEKMAENVFDEKLMPRLTPVDTKPVREAKLVSLNWLIGAAASICLLIIGFFAGKVYTEQQQTPATTQITDMQSDIREMKQMVMFSMLKQPSASERLKAVHYVKEFTEPDGKVITALIKTLNEDDNVNVRLAAARALAAFHSMDQVREALANSLGKQQEPIVQLALIDILVELEEKRAVAQMQKLLESEETLDVVKAEAQKGLTVLM